jgi:SHS2 domain-containing protein
MTYEFLEHTADVKFLASGKDIEETFISCMNALNETIRGEIKVLGSEEKSFESEGKDLEGLLYSFLEEFLFLLDAEHFLVSKIKEIKIDVKDFKLKCVVVGDDSENYKFTNDVKAVTYSEMFVREKGLSWEAQVVLDV